MTRGQRFSSVAGYVAIVAVGFVLIGVEPKMEREVYSRLLKIEEIVEIVPLFGEYDLIAKVEAKDYNTIGEVVVAKIRSVEGVRTTKTLTKITF